METLGLIVLGAFLVPIAIAAAIFLIWLFVGVIAFLLSLF